MFSGNYQPEIGSCLQNLKLLDMQTKMKSIWMIYLERYPGAPVNIID